MTKRTRWKRCYPNIIGRRFFDAGEHGLGFFTVLKAYKCKTYSKVALAHDGSHWFNKAMIVVRTDEGCKYKIPYLPWLKDIEEADTHKRWDKFFDEQPWF